MNNQWTGQRFIAAAVCVLCFAGAIARGDAAAGGREVLSFDQDWRFHLGDFPEKGLPIDSGFDDHGWSAVNVPHDWMIEGPFDIQSQAGAGGGYLNGGVGWYRKNFTLPADAKGRRVFAEFDGVYMDSDMWLNGHPLGNHPYGYTSFEHDLTPFVNFDGPNLLVARLHDIQPCSRWYSGAGIYRHVRLVITDPLHVDYCGVGVTTPQVSDASATVRVAVSLRNDGDQPAGGRTRVTLLGPGGEAVANLEMSSKVNASSDMTLTPQISIPNPQRWSLKTPTLYVARTEVFNGDRLVDRVDTPFGIRTIEFTKDRGFLLNGVHVPMQGVCDHHDLGCLGSAVNRSAIRRQLTILKSMGCNAIRTSHNPPAPELLELCDQMGFVVMDEAFDEWLDNKTANGYGRFYTEWSERDLVSMVHRDRNHPCVVMWSIGNEIPEKWTSTGAEEAARLAGIVHREDSTRPVTSACNSPDGADRSGFGDALDVFGVNYDPAFYPKAKGARLLVASETASAFSTRGEYGLKLDSSGAVTIDKHPDFQCTSYDIFPARWGNTAEESLLALRNAPYVAGEFVWTGFDYIGEPTPYNWPSRSSYFGIVDLCGFPKDRFYLYQSVWGDVPVVHLLPHWTWPGFEGKTIPVWCFTNAESVELFLNGKSLGEKRMDDPKRLHLEWQVPYAAGELKAVGKRGGKEIGEDVVRTAGKAARIELTAEPFAMSEGADDLGFVQARVVDEHGVVCPDASNPISFSVSGGAKILATDNGDATDHDVFHSPRRRAFHGLALAVLGPNGGGQQATLTANADGLAAGSCEVKISQ